MHPLRSLRGGLSERAGHGNPEHRLGCGTPAGTVGWRSQNQRVLLRFLRPLRDRLSVQRLDGEVHARRGGPIHSGAPASARSLDRAREVFGGVHRLRAVVHDLGCRGKDARAGDQENEDRLHVLWRRLCLRRVDLGTQNLEGRAQSGSACQWHLDVYQRQVRVGLRQQRRSPHVSVGPRRWALPTSQLGRGAFDDGAALAGGGSEVGQGQRCFHLVFQNDQRRMLPSSEARSRRVWHQQRG